MSLPEGVVVYKRTPSFTQDTVPRGLLRSHSTRPGVWGRIVVESGNLLFRDADGERRLAKGEAALVAPEQPHEVAPDGLVTFYVEFLRQAD